MNMPVDFKNLITIKQMLDEGLAFSEGTLKRWIFNRNQNGLAFAVLEDSGALLLDVTKFNVWLSLGKMMTSDFRNFRTKEQIVEYSDLKMSKVEHWLRNRFSNGLNEAVVNKSARRLYIDVEKFNLWLVERNANPAFGVIELINTL